jgi:hypothetical protein
MSRMVTRAVLDAGDGPQVYELLMNAGHEGGTV